MTTKTTTHWEPSFGERWRHGGWYVHNTRYPNGGCGCVHNNHIDDNKWHISSGEFQALPFSTRTDAANAEHVHVEHLKTQGELLAALQGLLAAVNEGTAFNGNPERPCEKAQAAIARATS